MNRGETNLNALLQSMKPELIAGEYVFCSVNDSKDIDPGLIVGSFREKEGITIIIDKIVADKLQLEYLFVAAWITLTVHSSLDAVGLTAAFSKALGDENISCNVIAAFYHDHLFVPVRDKEKAMEVLKKLSGKK